MERHFIGRRGQRGFTLIESLLAMVVISALVIAVAQIMIKAIDSYSLIVDRREVLQEARLAVNMMTNELQTIVHPGTDIASISATAITFTPAGGAAITYSVQGNTLLRDAKTLANNVTASTGFGYYTAGGAVTADPTKVYLIHIVVEVDTGMASHGKVRINSNVYLRNRYYNGFTQS